MAFKFNSGAGAIICDHCRVIIEEPAKQHDWMESHDHIDTRLIKDFCEKHKIFEILWKIWLVIGHHNHH